MGPCHTDGNCCGPGSLCCQNTGPHEHMEFKKAYVMIADELNDGGPGQVAYEDLDPDIRRDGAYYAYLNDLPWPPGIGDLDRFWEREQERKRHENHG